MSEKVECKQYLKDKMREKVNTYNSVLDNIKISDDYEFGYTIFSNIDYWLNELKILMTEIKILGHAIRQDIK